MKNFNFDEVLKSKPLLNKIAFITGGSSGLGKQISIQFVEMGAKVFVTFLKGEEQFVHQHENIILLELDLRDWDSISKCVEQLSEQTDHLDIFVSNAGVVRPKLYVTKHKLEETLTINSIGPGILTFKLQEKHLLPNAVSDSIQNDQFPRAIFVSSDMHRQGGNLSFDQLTRIEPFSIPGALQRYAKSKQLVALFAMELSRKTKNSLLVTFLCPGAFFSNLSVYGVPPLISKIVQGIRWLVCPSAYEAAKSISFLATQKDLQTGSYFYQTYPNIPSDIVRDEKLGEEYWNQLHELLISNSVQE